MRICHIIVGGGGGSDPPYKTFYHRKTDFLFVKQSFLTKFCQPVRSSWVKQSGETYPKNKEKISFTKENQFFGGKKSCRCCGPNPRPNKQMADFGCCNDRCI